MSLLATDKGGDFETVPEGTYIARCYRIIDMGTQTSPKFGTEAHNIMISWELIGPDDPKMQDGRPFTIHNTYSVSLNEKSNLRKHLEAWRGRKFTPQELEGFDLGNVLGAYCMMQVVHSVDGQFANIQAIMSYKGEKPVPVNPDSVFDIDEPDMTVFDKLSDKTKAKIMAAPEWKATRQASITPDVPTKQPAKPNPQQEITEQNIDKVFDVGDEPVNLDDIPF